MKKNELYRLFPPEEKRLDFGRGNIGVAPGGHSWRLIAGGLAPFLGIQALGIALYTAELPRGSMSVGMIEAPSLHASHRNPFGAPDLESVSSLVWNSSTSS